MKIKYIGILLIILLQSVQVNAQVYPVQINTQLIPPYSLRLSDYVSPGTNRVGVNVFLSDITKPDYYIRLELLIEGDGITIRTSPNFNPGPMILQGGVPEYLTSSDLTQWFEPQNLDFTGYSKSAYLSSGRLPEGVYRISFCAYDYNKHVRVSNNTPITAWMLLNEPPIINLPFPDYKVEFIDPQNIVFQWTPRHTASPNSAFTTEYEFTLVEIWPEGRDPNNAIQTSVPFFQTTTMNTTLVYGLSEPFLEPGRQYAYRIQAYDTDGRDMFKNNGYSEVHKFTFGDECKEVNNVEAKAEKYYEAEISWQPLFNQTAFNVRYRKADDPDAEWFEEDSYIDYVKLSDLQELTKYEYQVLAYCGTYDGDYTDIKSFTTPAIPVSSFECGAGDDESSIPNHDPLPALYEGNYVWSGNFMFKIKEATGSNGTFSGTAYAMVPYLSYVKLEAEFSNIKINTDNQVYEGTIKSVYNPDSPFIIGIGGGDDDDDDESGGGSTDDTEISDTTFTTDIDSVYIDGDDIIIITEDGTDTIHTTDDIIITDENGDTWLVEDGVVIVGGGGTGPGGGGSGGGSTDEPIISEETKIEIKAEFQLYDKQNFGYDKLTYDVHKPTYEQISINDEMQYVPWKSISSTGSDKVLVKITDYDSIITPDHVKYRTSSGIELASFKYEGQNDLRMIVFNGKAKEETEGIEAYITYRDTGDTQKEKILGKISTISYDKQNINLVIVPVNGHAGFSAVEFTTALNDIYKHSVIEWNVTLDEVYNIDREDWDKNDEGEAGYDKMNDGESTLLSNYSDEQNKLRRKYKSDRDVDKQTYYVFLLNGIQSETGLAGYMPLKEQYAFIYDGNNDARTIAHELGHGAFRLWHTFSSESDYYMAQKSSDNLMDYNDGSRLHKYQWDFIHNPEGGFYMFQDEEEGASQIWSDPICTQKVLEQFRWAYVNKQKLEYKADGYPWIGHYANDIMLDEIIYEKITVEVRQDLGFTPSIVNYEELYGRAVFNYGKVLSITTENKFSETSKYLFPTASDWENQITQLVKDIALESNRTNILEKLAVLPYQEYTRFSGEERGAILKLIASSFITEDKISCRNDEDIVINLVRYTPDEKIKSLFDVLQKDNLMQELCSKIHNTFGEDNYTSFIGALTSLYLNKYRSELTQVSENWDTYSNDKFHNESLQVYFMWNREFNTDVRVTWDKEYENNKIIFTSVIGDRINNKSKIRPPIDPFEIVIVNFKTKPSFISSNIPENILFAMPAFMFEWICNEYENYQFESYLNGGVTFSSCFVAISALTKGAKILALLKAINSIGDLALLNDNFKQIVINNLGTEALILWDAIDLVLQIESPLEEIYINQTLGNFTKFRLLWAVFKEDEKYKELLNANESREAISFAERLMNDIKEIEENE